MVFFLLQKIGFNILTFLISESFALKIIYKVSLGKNCRLKNNNYGSEPYLISFGNQVSSINVDFVTHDGAVWLWRKNNPDIEYFKRIKIGSNVFIGINSTILPGSQIGSNVIIGAGSIVKGEINSGFVYAGVPAKKISTIDEYYKKNKNNFTMTKTLDYRKKRDFLLKLITKKPL